MSAAFGGDYGVAMRRNYAVDPYNLHYIMVSRNMSSELFVLNIFYVAIDIYPMCQ